MSFVSSIKNFLRQPSILRNLFLWLGWKSQRPGTLMMSESAAGLRLVHIADNAIEADLLRQEMRNAGFYVIHVPSASMGIFGTNMDTGVYARQDEYDEAVEFLREYLQSPIISEE